MDYESGAQSDDGNPSVDDESATQNDTKDLMDDDENSSENVPYVTQFTLKQF